MNKKADGTVIGDLRYEYDAAGRRISMGGSLAQLALPPADITDATYDANNRLVTWDGKAYSYDDNGSLSGNGADEFQWDERGRLSAIRRGGIASASFQYDFQNRRTGKTAGSVTTGFLYDGSNVVQELEGTSNAAGIKAHLLTSGLDEVFLRLDGNDGAKPQSVLSDANNNTIMLLDATQNGAVRYAYEPYGFTTADGSSGNSQQYTGRENDNPGNAEGLYYYRARYYMPGIGRFIAEDPIGWASGQTNSYAYAGGNPISFRDPTGFDSTGPEPGDPGANDPGWPFGPSPEPVPGPTPPSPPSPGGPPPCDPPPPQCSPSPASPAAAPQNGPTLSGKICRNLCKAAGAVACAGIVSACGTGTVLTVGGLSVPCVPAATGVCVFGTGMCSDLCPN